MITTATTATTSTATTTTTTTAITATKLIIQNKRGKLIEDRKKAKDNDHSLTNFRHKSEMLSFLSKKSQKRKM